jgi:Ca-activated chloride channel family protein
MGLNDFHFLRPFWLLGLIPVVGFCWWYLKGRSSGDDWLDYCDPALLPHILIDRPSKRRYGSLWILGLAGVLGVIALGGPAYERLPTPVFRNLSSLVILLDLSYGMDATDIKPSRIERARYKIEDLLRARKEGQTALIAYAGDAFVVTPLTDDGATIAAQLMALSPKIMPEQGARLDLGLTKAADLLFQAGQKSGDILVVTAGEEVDAARSEAARLLGEGIRVSVLGVGTKDGAPIPMPEGGFRKGSDGRIVVSRLEIKPLWDLAQAGGGVYRSLDAGSKDTAALLDFLDRKGQGPEDKSQKLQVDQWRDEGIWLLPPLVFLAALGFQRGGLALILLVFLIPLPSPVNAFEWQDLWWTKDQQAERALKAGDPKKAADLFKRPDWKAAAQYKAGDFKASEEVLQGIKTPQGLYNLGNALAQEGKLEEALKTYDEALSHLPGDDDTITNRKLVEDALKQQQQQQKDKNQDKEKDGKKDPSDGSKGGKDQKSGQKDQKSDGQQGQKGDKDPSSPKNSNENPSKDQKDKEEDKGEHQDEPPQDPKDSKGSQGQHGSDQNQKDSPPPPEPKPNATPSPQDDQNLSPPEEGAPKDAPSPPSAPDPKKPQGASEGAPQGSEEERAEAQWLRRIPDDPGGLLKRKFYYQYRLRQQQSHP